MKLTLEAYSEVTEMLAQFEPGDASGELAFAMLAVDETHPASLYWLAACAIARATEIKNNEK